MEFFSMLSYIWVSNFLQKNNPILFTLLSGPKQHQKLLSTEITKRIWISSDEILEEHIIRYKKWYTPWVGPGKVEA